MRRPQRAEPIPDKAAPARLYGGSNLLNEQSQVFLLFDIAAHGTAPSLQRQMDVDCVRIVDGLVRRIPRRIELSAVGFVAVWPDGSGGWRPKRAACEPVPRRRGISATLSTVDRGRPRPYFPPHSDGPVAQLVEHLTFNQVVAGSIPAGLTILPDCNLPPNKAPSALVSRHRGRRRLSVPPSNGSAIARMVPGQI